MRDDDEFLMTACLDNGPGSGIGGDGFDYGSRSQLSSGGGGWPGLIRGVKQVVMDLRHSSSPMSDSRRISYLF